MSPSDTPATWAPDRAPPPSPWPRPGLKAALWRGARGRCPVCGEGQAFRGFLRVAEACGHCGAPLGRLRADDAPPYFTIFLVGHLVVPPILMVERLHTPPMWLHMAVWLPLIAVLTTLLLRPVKGGHARADVPPRHHGRGPEGLSAPCPIEG
jgi:uncharacterized protein (DUF983 family)